MRRKFFVLSGIIILLVFFYGCSGLKKPPITKIFFNLAPEIPVFNKNNLGQGSPLMVKTFAIDPAYDSQSFVYQTGENQYVSDYYNEFIGHPARLITEQISTALYASDHFRPITTDARQDIAFRLSGKIIRLSGDFKDPDNPMAAIGIQMILEKNMGPDFKPVLTNVYVAREPISNRSPSDLVSGWNIGLSKIFQQFLDEIHDLSALSSGTL